MIFPTLRLNWQNIREQFSKTFVAFRHPNFRLWFMGQLVSLVGTWMQSTAQGYLVFELTHDPAFLGYVAVASGVPAWLFTLLGGLVSDRIPRRNMLVLTQAAMMVLAFILAGLVFTGLIQPWMIIVLAFFLGTANAFDAPSRLAFVYELVDDREDIPNAIALNASMFNLATVVGPAVSGLTYAAVGSGWCFFINGLSFIAVITSLLLMRLRPFERRVNNGSPLAEIETGLKFVAQNTIVRTIIINLGIAAMFTMGLVSLLPAWVTNVLGGDVTYNGYLLSARGIGSLIATLLLAYLVSRRIRGYLWSFGNLLVPLGMFFFVWADNLQTSLLAIGVVGLAYMLVTNNSNALVQDNVTDELRGRVMSIYSLVFFGLSPLGSLILGVMASQINEITAVIFAAIALLIVAVAIQVFYPKIRRLG